MFFLNKKRFFFKPGNRFINRLLYRLFFPGRYKHMLVKMYNKGYENSIKGFFNTNIVFIHIPKCAGISLNYSLYNCKGGGHVPAIEYKYFFRPTVYDALYKFTIVRNPFDRLYSAYMFLRKGGRNESDYAFSLQNILPYSTFEEFVMNWLNESNIYSGIHFIPQSDFICDIDGRLLVDHIGYYECIDKEYDIIRRRSNVDLPKSLSKKNLTKDIGDFREAYTKEMINRVVKVYSNDFKLLKYDPFL